MFAGAGPNIEDVFGAVWWTSLTWVGMALNKRARDTQVSVFVFKFTNVLCWAHVCLK